MHCVCVCVSTLQTPGLASRTYLPTLFIGVLQANAPWLGSWGSFLISMAAWYKVALLAGFPRGQVFKAMLQAMLRGASMKGYCKVKSESWLRSLHSMMPCFRQTCAKRLCRWLQVNAYWHNGTYSSWHITHEGQHTDICGQWDVDIRAIRALGDS